MAESQEIELELPEEEVDPREADVIQEPQQDFDTSEAEAETSQPDELEDYSEGVKKRIDKLTYRMREAERQRDEAVQFAKKMSEQTTTLQNQLKSSDSTLVAEYSARIAADKERARRALKEAQELGDAEAIALATEVVAKTSLEAQNAERLVAKQKSLQSSTAQPSQTHGGPVPQEPTNLQPAAPDPRAEAWASENTWFGEDEGMTYAAMGIHQKLLKEGVPPSSDYYFERVDSEIRELFPNRFPGGKKNVQSSVAGASRGAGAVKKGARNVKLTPSQVAIAKRIGVPLEEYAKYL